jgi:hypothetical protein
MSRFAAIAVVLAFTAACGGEDENILPTIDGPVTQIDAPPGPDAPGGPKPTGIAVTGDFSVTGVFSTIDVDTVTVDDNALAGVAGGEPWIRKFGSELFIVNRAGGNNVTIVGTSPFRFVDQFGTGGGSNPQDVAVVGEKLYVPVFDARGGLKVINRTTRAVTDISLAALDSDMVPNCISAAVVGTRVFVACEVLDASFTPRGPGKIAVIDTATDTLVTSFDLANNNPFGRFIATPAGGMFGGDLLIPTAPSLTNYTTGCLERVSTGNTPAANGCAATNATLSGYVSGGEAAADGGMLWIAVTSLNPDFSTNFAQLRSIDLANGTLGPVISSGTTLIAGAATCPGGRILAADITFGSSGVRVFDGTTEVTDDVLDVGRPVNAPNGLLCY